MTATVLALCACEATGSISGGASASPPTNTGTGGAIFVTTGGAGVAASETGDASAVAQAGAGGQTGGAGGAMVVDAGAPDELAAADAVTSTPPSAPTPTCKPGLPASVADLQSQTSDDTTSTVTPLGRRYEGVAAHVATSDEQAFLADAHQQPVIPGSTSGLSWKMLTVTLFPSGALPTPADVNQHAIGNCDGDTAFAAIAYLDAPFLKRIITDNQDGTFTVAMYDPKGQRLSVSLDDQFLVDGGGNIGEVSGKNNVADWATVLEKATMKYIQVYPVVSDIGGIGSEHQTPMFTGAGGSFAFDRGKLGPADLTRLVRAALAAGKIISGGFGIEGKAQSNGFETVTAHGYAVLVPKSDAFMIAMRNPWGVDPTAQGYNGNTDGVLDIPPATDWASTIDLRVIEPGDACGPGATSPYVPSAAATRALTTTITEPHALVFAPLQR